MDELQSFNLYFPISGCIVYPGWDDDYDDYRQRNSYFYKR